MLFILSLIVFILLYIFRVIYVKKNLSSLNENCKKIAEQYLDELNNFRSNKFKKSITNIFTPSAIKIITSEKSVDNLSETVVEEIPLVRIAKGIFQHYKKDEQIEYLKDKFILFNQPDIEINRYKNHSFSYFFILLAFLAILNSPYEENLINIAFFLMIPAIISGIYKTFLLIHLKNKEDGDKYSIIIEDYKAKYIFSEIDQNRIEVFVNNKIEKVVFTYTSKYSFT